MANCHFRLLIIPAKAGIQRHPNRYRLLWRRDSLDCDDPRLDESGGAIYARLRGAAKVLCHLMFGVLVVTVEQLTRLVT